MTERMNKAAVLLQPGEQVDGTAAPSGGAIGFPPGAYRIEAIPVRLEVRLVFRGRAHGVGKDGKSLLARRDPASVRVTLER